MVLAGLAVVLPVPAAAAPPMTPPGRATAEQFAKGRILVEPRAGLSNDAFENVLKPHGGKSRKIGQSNLHIVDLPGNGSEKSVVAMLSRHPHIKSAELDRLVPPAFVPNDPYYGSEAHLAVIGASAAWDTSQGAGIVIAILDSGVDAAHPDLAAQLVPGYNFYDNNTDTTDIHGHGTAVAGVAAAALDNGQGVAGVAGRSKIMPLRITDPNAWAYYSTITQALTWAADHGARVANCSYDGVAASASIQSAASYMRSKGGLVIVSAGNTGSRQAIAATTSMIPVSATDNNDALASWSSYGDYVAISAPGTAWTTSRGGFYQQWQGTSFSSPLTAGVVALMMSANPVLDAAAVEKLLFSSARDLGGAGRDIYYGWGRVDAAAAVRDALSATQPVDTEAPNVLIGAPLASSTVSGIVAVDVSARDNVGVERVELAVGTTTVAVDGSVPFGFSWDSASVVNGMTTLTATAFDAAGNKTVSAPVSVNVANYVAPPPVQDRTPPTVQIVNPQAGRVAGKVAITVNASDDAGAAGIRQWIYLDGSLKASGSGSSLSYDWNTRKEGFGVHKIVAVAKDAAGNSTSVSVEAIK